MKTRIGSVSLCVLILGLVGCTTVPTAPPVVSLDATELRARQAARDAALSTLKSWEFAGRVKVTGNERPTNAELVWVRKGPVSRITLSGPGGLRASTLEVAPGSVVLRQAGGDVVRADNPDQLIEKLVGWPMPLSLMDDWVLGLPGDSSVLSRDALAHLNVAQYREWTGRLDEYSDVSGITLPHSIDVTDGHLRVAISIRRWRAGSNEPASTGRISIPGVGG